MRLLSVRLIVSLIVGITLVSSGFSYYEVLGRSAFCAAMLERRDESAGGKSGRQRQRAWNSASDTYPFLRHDQTHRCEIQCEGRNAELQQLRAATCSSETESAC
jgi:hypothetical protein